MVQAVDADKVPLFCHPPHQVFVFLDGISDEEKGDMDAALLKAVQKLRRVFLIGAVVKGQGHDCPRLCSRRFVCRHGKAV